MMKQAGAQRIPAPVADGYPQEPIDMQVARGLLEIEFAHAGDAAEARLASTLTMTERDVAMASVPEVEPPKMTEEELVAALNKLIDHLRGFKRQSTAQAAE
jgi:hypothetical protein